MLTGMHESVGTVQSGLCEHTQSGPKFHHHDYLVVGLSHTPRVGSVRPALCVCVCMHEWKP